MRKLFTLLGIALLSLNGIAQNNPIEKTKPIGNPATSIDFEENTKFEIDTLYITSGKTYVILIDVNKEYDDDSVTVAGGPVDDEEKELLKNFEENSFEIIKQYKHTLILFENGQKLDLSSIDNTFQGLAYWHGNIEDDIKFKNNITKSTEFVAEQMDLNTQSSYVINNEKYKKALNLTQNKNEFTKKSKLIMNAFLDNIYKTFLTNRLGQDASLLNTPPENLKKMNLYITAGSKEKLLSRSVEINKKGQVDKLILFDRDGEISRSIQYRYKNEILKKTITDEGTITTFSYDDAKMISFRNIGSADETNIYYLKNNRINNENYVIMIDEGYSSQNTLSKTIHEKNCEIRYINDAVWTRNCSTDPNVFPYIHTYISYQDDEVLQYRKFKIEKENEKVYKKYYSNAKQETDKDVYSHKGTYQLNDNNLVNKYTFIDDQKSIRLEIEYMYHH